MWLQINNIVAFRILLQKVWVRLICLNNFKYALVHATLNVNFYKKKFTRSILAPERATGKIKKKTVNGDLDIHYIMENIALIVLQSLEAFDDEFSPRLAELWSS